MTIDKKTNQSLIRNSCSFVYATFAIRGFDCKYIIKYCVLWFVYLVSCF